MSAPQVNTHLWSNKNKVRSTDKQTLRNSEASAQQLFKAKMEMWEALIRNGREENHAVMMLKEEERRCKTTAPVRLYSFKILNLDYTFRSHLSPQLCYFLVIPHSRFMRSVHGYFRYAVLRGLKPHAHKHSALCVAIFRWQINSKHATAAMPL